MLYILFLFWTQLPCNELPLDTCRLPALFRLLFNAYNGPLEIDKTGTLEFTVERHSQTNVFYTDKIRNLSHYSIRYIYDKLLKEESDIRIFSLCACRYLEVFLSKHTLIQSSFIFIFVKQRAWLYMSAYTQGLMSLERRNLHTASHCDKYLPLPLWHSTFFATSIHRVNYL